MSAENQLVIVSSSDLTASDYVRVLVSGSSRNIEVTDFVTALTPVLTSAGFVTNTSSAVTINVKTKSSNYGLTVDDRVILVNTASGNVNINLPAAADVWDAINSTSQEFTVKRITTDVNYVSLLPNGAELIDGNSAFNIVGPSLGSVTFVSNGSNWFIVQQ
jgi:hypothetical protein